ncbi:hydrolase, inner membrane [Canicola haemoglobinophilus]|uniref:Hydrolase, inner membrane n=1 Tax=Canicola haemoglobinophilus TaxID=733 RepID=A0A377HWT9_9PAST|nr:phosphoethanolamine transferase [Canicola haemoglobinophilus]STO60874.1 hydrolase, inner membrane [Canicola haemoglobinophilus]
MIIFSFNKDIYRYIKGGDFTIEKNEIYPIQFVIDIYQLTSFYMQESHELETALSIPSTWNVISSNPKYKNFILIIGESMRKDYMSSYGYPIETTPFLSKIPGVIFNNYVSAAPNTQPSLKHTLYRKQEEGKFIYTDNIISLANKANFKTYWLSNQGIFERNDTSASRIGQQADYSFFTKKSFSDRNYFDTVLLEPLKKSLTEKTEKTKLIVLHLMGSHPEFCQRLEKQPTEKRFSKEIDCYIESIKQTDHFIATINEILKQTNQSYSVIYFSDHGLSHYKNRKTLAVGNKYKQNYEIPFIKFSSDDVTREYIQAPKSAFHFMGGFAQWLGIQEKHLQQEPNFFSEKTILPIKVFNWQKFVNFKDLDSDPAIAP